MEQSKNQSWAITLFAIGVFMAALDNGIISAALTTINNNFDVSPSAGAWGITLYTLGLSVSVPIVGKLSDKFGRKRLFVIEVALFGLGSLLVALSPSFPLFLAARLVQALGGGGIFIIGSSHILTVVPKEQQGKALGLLGGMNGIAAVLGPNIGSFLLSWTGSWHWLFLVNVPIALGLVIVGMWKIVETKLPKTAPLDFTGTLFLAVAILSIMYGITNVSGADLVKAFAQPKVYGFLIAGVIVFAGLLYLENRLEKNGGDPVLPFSVLRNPAYVLTLFIGVGAGILIAGVIFVPSFVQQYLGIDAGKAGYWMTPLALASGIGAGGGGAFVDKQGPIRTIFISAIISFIGFLLFPLWVTTLWQFVIASMIAGFGFGMLLGAPLNVLATEHAGENKGPALAVLSLSRQIGLTLAPTIYAGFLTRAFEKTGDTIMTNLKAANVNMSMLGNTGANTANMTQNQLIEMLKKIPDTNIQKIITDSIHTVTGNGFYGLFMTAAVVSAIMFILAVILKPVRERGLKQLPEQKVENY